MYRFRAVVILGVILALMIAAFPALAQDDLGQTAVAADGSYSFQVPADWMATELDNQIILATSTTVAFEHLITDGLPQAGDIIVMALGPDAILEELGTQADLAAMGAAMEASLGEDDMPIIFDEVQVFPLPDGRQAATAEVAEDSQMGGAFIVIEEEGKYLGMLLLTTQEDYAASEELLGNIALSLRLGGAEEAAASQESYSLVWSQADVFENINGAIAMGDDRFYVSDGAGGVLVFSMEGEQIGAIEFEGAMVYDSPVLAGDGNLWVSDSFNQTVYLVTQEGEVLQSFGGEDQFDSISPNYIALGPDGNLYAANSGDEGDSIQVWSAEGEFLREFPIGGEESFIWAMDMAADGNLYVVDLMSGIMIYDSEGTLVNDNFGGAQTFFQMISAIAVMPDGSVFISREALEGEEGAEVVHLDANGNLLGSFTSADLGIDQFYNPMDFAMTADGHLIMTDGNIDGSQILMIAIAPAEAASE
ncbi:MAG: NHL repeat-containing protein [Anaerolineae bacterium]|nr:NHL repeat-containing protein [Anaerolineae bacterium]